jgi:hypothetical protein
MGNLAPSIPEHEASSKKIKNKKEEKIERNLRETNMPYGEDNNRDESSEEMQERSKNTTQEQDEKSL